MLHIQCSFSFMGSLKAAKSYTIGVWAQKKEESVMADLFLILSLVAIFVSNLVINFQQRAIKHFVKESIKETINELKSVKEEEVQECSPCKACGSTEWDTSGHNEGYCWFCSDKLDYYISLGTARKEYIEANTKLDEMYLLQEEMEKADAKRVQVKKVRNGATHPKCSVCSSRHCTWDHVRNANWGSYPAKAHKAHK
jgi:hypothetical protein